MTGIVQFTQGGDDMVDIASGVPGEADAKYGLEIVRSSKVLDGIQAAQDKGIRYLTLYAFSKENWRRPKEEEIGRAHV
jgi:hypothetical protein